jgi:hypothetical protein
MGVDKISAGLVACIFSRLSVVVANFTFTEHDNLTQESGFD